MLRLRRISLLAILFCGLFHAWFGHDLLHGHHHHDLEEASYSTVWKGQADHLSSLLSSPALTTDVFLWEPPSTDPWIATVEALEFTYSSAHLLDTSQAPRPPPVFSFIA